MDPETEQEILRLHREGEGIRPIAKRLKMGRKTIRRVLRNAGLLTETRKPTDAAQPTPSKLDPFKDLVREKAQEGLSSPRILREIRALGFTGGRTILVDYLREVRGPRPKRSAFRRFETAPGEEAQGDWSPYRVEIAGKTRTVHAFSLVLCMSRKLHVRFYWNEKLPTLLYALEQALAEFQGSTRRIVFDNMATVTLGRQNRKPLWNERFLEFSRHYMFEPFVCRPRDPNRKGKVERPFAYLEQDFLKGRTFPSLEALNEAVIEWLREVANRRVHGTTRRIPDEAWEKEKHFLVKLPDRPFGSYRQEVRRVHVDGLFPFDGVRYSAPSHLADTQVTVRATPREIEVLDALGNRVAVHRVSEKKGDMVIDASHQPPRRRQRQRELEDEILRRFPGAADFLAGLQRRMGPFRHVHLTKLRALATRYQESDLLCAIRRAGELKSFNAHAVARLLERMVPFVPEPPHLLNPGADAVLSAIAEDDDWGSLEQYRGLEGGDDADNPAPETEGPRDGA